MDISKEINQAIDMADLHAENAYWASNRALTDTRNDAFIAKKEASKIKVETEKVIRLSNDFGKVVGRNASFFKIETIFGEVLYYSLSRLKDIMSDDTLILVNAGYNAYSDEVSINNSNNNYITKFKSAFEKVVRTYRFDEPMMPWAVSIFDNTIMSPDKIRAVTKFTSEMRDAICKEAEKLINKAHKDAGEVEIADKAKIVSLATKTVGDNIAKWRAACDTEFARAKHAAEAKRAAAKDESLSEDEKEELMNVNTRFRSPKLVTFSDKDVEELTKYILGETSAASSIKANTVEVTKKASVGEVVINSKTLVVHNGEVYAQIGVRGNNEVAKNILKSNKLATDDFPVCTAIYQDDKYYRLNCIEELLNTGAKNSIYAFDEYLVLSYNANTVIITKLHPTPDGAMGYKQEMEYNLGCAGGSLDAEHIKNISLASSGASHIVRLTKANK